LFGQVGAAQPQNGDEDKVVQRVDQNAGDIAQPEQHVVIGG
jgi:hypothetical protein